MSDKEEFLARLELLLDGRKRSPWAKALGFSGGTLTRLGATDTPIPGPTELRAIMWSENVSLNWLCEGIGPKFMSSTARNAGELCNFVADELGDDFNRIRIFHAGSGEGAILFSRPSEKQYKGDTTYKFTAATLLYGEFSAKLQHLLKPFNREIEVYLVDSDRLLEIEQGEFGTYRLEQLTTEAEPSDLGDAFNCVSESEASARYLRLAIEMVEQAMADDGTFLDAKQKARVIMAIYQHAQSQKIDLTPDVVKLLIDAAA